MGSFYRFDTNKYNSLTYTNCTVRAQVLCSAYTTNYKQLLNEVFVISEIIKVEVSVISRSRRLRLITLTETLIIPDFTKTESNNCFIIQAILIFLL